MIVSQVRKLWCDYSEAKGAIASPFSSSTTSAESREGDDFDADVTPIPSSVPIHSSGSLHVAAGQGPARALRAFVDAVDLTDARQAAVLQNLVSVLEDWFVELNRLGRLEMLGAR